MKAQQAEKLEFLNKLHGRNYVLLIISLMFESNTNLAVQLIHDLK